MISQTSGRVLVVDDDAARLGAVSDALRASGHEVHAFGGGSEAREWLAGAGVDVVLATASVASELDPARHASARRAAWILRADPSARPPERGMFIASVPVDASPRSVAETVAVAMSMKHARTTPRPRTASTPGGRSPVAPSSDRGPGGRRQTPADGALPAPPPGQRRLDPPPDLPFRRPITGSHSKPTHDLARARERELAVAAGEVSEVEAETADEAQPAPRAAPSARRVGVVARDAKVVRRLCELFQEKGYDARGFTAARTALDVVLSGGFDALVTEDRLDDLDACALVERVALKLGERAPRVLVIGRAEVTLEPGGIATRVPSPATAESLLEALTRVLGPAIPESAPEPAAERADAAAERHDAGPEAARSPG